IGLWYAELGRGDGSAQVDPTPWIPRSHSRETTYQQDLLEAADIAEAVRELAGQVADDCAGEGRPVVRIALKIRYAPFFTVTRARKLPATTAERGEVVSAAMTLAREKIEPNRAIRLLGVRAEMTPP
ncbi:MAG: DNA polymerase IV, partial [Micrococcales bacterium]|nr:DNA polymerase IV [Micrococcales bacterium]